VRRLDHDGAGSALRSLFQRHKIQIVGTSATSEVRRSHSPFASLVAGGEQMHEGGENVRRP
jgi:hypothetical protein